MCCIVRKFQRFNLSLLQVRKHLKSILILSYNTKVFNLLQVTFVIKAYCKKKTFTQTIVILFLKHFVIINFTKVRCSNFCLKVTFWTDYFDSIRGIYVYLWLFFTNSCTNCFHVNTLNNFQVYYWSHCECWTKYFVKTFVIVQLSLL